MKKVEISASIRKIRLNFIEVKMDKVTRSCSACGHGILERPYGTIFIPKVAGLPEEILIKIKEDKE